ncbi:hypothetical protein BH23GEM6_BH23GEM6_17910 [soil metagenome]
MRSRNWPAGAPLWRLVSLTSSLLLVLAVGAVAQSTADDAGTFVVSVGGHQVGIEEFSIRQSGVGAGAEIVAIGRVNLNLATGSLELVPRLRTTGFQADPVSYEVTVGGDSPRRITGTVGSGRFSARIVTASGEQMREYVATSGASVLDDGVAHHYYFIARRTRSGRVPILIPRENRQVMATVRDLGEERVNINGAMVSLFRLSVAPEGGDERHVWVDALNRVIRVEIPARGYLAVRTEVPR